MVGALSRPSRNWGRTSQFQAGEAEETVAVRPQCGPHLNTAKQFSELHNVLVNTEVRLSAAA